MKLKYSKNPYFVTMYTYHMAILLHYQSTDSIMYSDLQEQTQLNDDMFQKHLQNLIEAKLLLCQDQVKIYLASGYFSLGL